MEVQNFDAGDNVCARQKRIIEVLHNAMLYVLCAIKFRFLHNSSCLMHCVLCTASYALRLMHCVLCTASYALCLMRNSKWPFSKWPFFEVAFPSGLFFSHAKKISEKKFALFKIKQRNELSKIK